MKLSKTLIIAALAAGSLFAAGFAVQAQDSTNKPPAVTPPPGPPPGGPGARPRINVDRIAMQLGLDEATKAKAKPVFEEMFQKQIDLRNDSSMDPTARRAKMKEIRDDSNAKLKDILTPEQYEKWTRMGPGGRRPPGAPGGPAGPGAQPPPAQQPPAGGVKSPQ